MRKIKQVKVIEKSFLGRCIYYANDFMKNPEINVIDFKFECDMRSEKFIALIFYEREIKEGEDYEAINEEYDPYEYE